MLFVLGAERRRIEAAFSGLRTKRRGFFWRGPHRNDGDEVGSGAPSAYMVMANVGAGYSRLLLVLFSRPSS